MKPIAKAPFIEGFLEKVSGRSTAILNLKCVSKPIGCGREILPEELKDWPLISVKEYRINGLCKACQDSIFG